ncbi:hypothetical protein [Knoellia koreensis]|uniref:Uncharacterized protein n=1 Tax=Knoellia koreensis TaxID=2730921 RepID=A0A849HGG6_9MICO|nr:hypothetical protein [Knoellia sp. DB2414S]NNM46352.1 hypothetical protein [Knoellia sp. DB2414S]
MSEPSSAVPKEIADADVEDRGDEAPEKVELDVDEEKLKAWDEVKSDYEVDPGGEPVPNSQEESAPSARADDGEPAGGRDEPSADDEDAAERH